MEHVESEPLNKTYQNLYICQKKLDDTKERIFPTAKKEKIPIVIKKKFIDPYMQGGYINNKKDHLNEILNSKAKENKIQKETSKPCNNDFNLVADEAKKNASVRYYFESNTSQW